MAVSPSREEAGSARNALPVFLALLMLPAGLLPALLGAAGWGYGVAAAVAGAGHLAWSARPSAAGGGASGRAAAGPAAAHLAALALVFALDRAVLGSATPATRALPHLHATLNAWAALSVVAGVAMIRRDRREAHRACMLSAAAASSIFLASYLVYHARVGSVPYEGGGLGRVAYLAMLASHVILAVALVPLVLVTLARALGGREEAHRRIARWTAPIWLYVSVTGLVVYWVIHG